MSNTNVVYARIDKQLKDDAESILKKLGISPSAAVQMMYSQIILNNGLPFRPVLPDYSFAVNDSGSSETVHIDANSSSDFSGTNCFDDAGYDLDKTLEVVKREIIREVPALMGDDCKKIILFGSCARGEYRRDSDVDVAVLSRLGREKNHKFNDSLVRFAADIAAKCLADINFICLPFDEFQSRKSWYPFYKNIEEEGVVLYG